MATTTKTISGWERVAMAIERIAARLEKTVRALEAGGVPYAVIGGNAVAEWVGRIDEGAVRFTKDVDILLRREDLAAAIGAMQAAGFQHHQVHGVDMFLEEPDPRPSEGVHVIFAQERVRQVDPSAAPDVGQIDREGSFSVIDLPSLLRMKLTSYRDKDRTHVRDMIGVGLIDASWVGRYDGQLAQRLQHIFDTPEG